MEIFIHHHEMVAAVFIARIFLGLLFFFQGYDAVFKVGIRNVIETFQGPLSGKGIPKVFIVIGAAFTSYVELIAGFCLIIGFVKYYALYLLGLDLIVASIAFGIAQPMWDMRFVFPRLVLLLFLLVIPSQWDILSVDYIWSVIKFLKAF